MTVTSPVDKEALLRALDELPPEAIAEVREFVAFQKYKTQANPAAGPVVIGGLLAGFHFDGDLIAEARTEMWGRLQD